MHPLTLRASVASLNCMLAQFSSFMGWWVSFTSLSVCVHLYTCAQPYTCTRGPKLYCIIEGRGNNKIMTLRCQSTQNTIEGNVWTVLVLATWILFWRFQISSTLIWLENEQSLICRDDSKYHSSLRLYVFCWLRAHSFVKRHKHTWRRQICDIGTEL